jgi:hypothetical protein
MAGSVVEVVVRFGDTILDVAHVRPHETYRIGTAPGLELAVPGHTNFPLVSGGSIRCPVGVPVRHIGATIELRFAYASIELTKRELDLARLARPRPPWRVAAFVAASLLVHIAVWLCAVTLEPFERLIERTNERPRMRYVHVADHDPPPEPPPKPVAKPVEPQPVPSASAPVSPPPRRARAERLTVTNQAEAAAKFAAMVDKTHVVERVSALRPEDTYNEDDANAKGFGGSPRFPPGETIATGDYKVMAYDVKLCPKKSCTITGPVPGSFIRAQLHEHMDAIYRCYLEHASEAGTIVLEFSIAGDGSVHNASGSGLGETGACAARVLPEIYFKAIGDNDVPEGKPKVTRVRYPIRFNDQM